MPDDNVTTPDSGSATPGTTQLSAKEARRLIQRAQAFLAQRGAFQADYDARATRRRALAQGWRALRTRFAPWTVKPNESDAIAATDVEALQLPAPAAETLRESLRAYKEQNQVVAGTWKAVNKVTFGIIGAMALVTIGFIGAGLIASGLGLAVTSLGAGIGLVVFAAAHAAVYLIGERRIRPIEAKARREADKLELLGEEVTKFVQLAKDGMPLQAAGDAAPSLEDVVDGFVASGRGSSTAVTVEPSDPTPLATLADGTSPATGPAKGNETGLTG